MRAAMLKRSRGPKELYDCAAYTRLGLLGETRPKRYLSKEKGLLRVKPFVSGSSAVVDGMAIMDYFGRNLTKPTKPSSEGFQGSLSLRLLIPWSPNPLICPPPNCGASLSS